MSQIPPSSLPQLSSGETREVVAEFADRVSFEAAVQRLLDAKFDRTDISVLATHDSLEVAGSIAGYTPQGEVENVATAIDAELPWLGPLVIAGTLLAVSGPIGLAVAGVVAAAAGVVALRPLLSEVTESVHAERFSEAIKQGRILLWVRTPSAAALIDAERILANCAGINMIRLAQPAHEKEGARLV